jgi:hypothetical protein
MSTDAAVSVAPEVAGELARIIDGRAGRAVFQPLIDLWPVVDVAERRLRVVMEVTERAVARDPAGLLGAVARARAVGWGVALDDVGAEPWPRASRPAATPRSLGPWARPSPRATCTAARG